jgi:hypothetical protein
MIPWRLVLCVTFALAVSCGDGGGPVGEGRLRIVNVVPDGPDVDVIVDNEEVQGDLRYLSATEYESVPSGSRHVRVNAAGTTTQLLAASVAVADGTDNTMFVAGLSSDIEPVVVRDDNSAPSPDHAKVRAVHLVPGAGPVDVYVTDPGADLGTEAPVLTGLSYGEQSEYLELVEGPLLQIRLTNAGTKTVVIDTGLITFLEGDVVTMMVVEAAGGGPPLALAGLLDENPRSASGAMLGRASSHD